MTNEVRFKRFHCVTVALVAVGLLGLANITLAQQSPGNFKTSYRYNSIGQQTGIIRPDPDGSGSLTYLATRNNFDSRGSLTLVEEGRLASYQSDTIAPKDWSGFAVHRQNLFSYDDLGRRMTAAVADASGTKYSLTQYSYDGTNRVVCKAGRMNPNVYDSLPSSACALGAEGAFGPDRITRYTYGPGGYGEVTKEERAVGTPLQQDYVRYDYDSYYRITGITDANGNYTHQTYDAASRLYRRYFPSKTVSGSYNSADYEQYSYDNNSNRTALRKRDGRWIYYTYDALNRGTKKNIPGTAEDVYYGYDLHGLQRYARYASAAGQGVTNTFDGFGNLAISALNMSGVTRTLSYHYDLNNNRTRVTHPDGKYWTFTYDDLDRIKNIYEYYYTLLATYLYDAHGRLTGLNRLNSAGTSYSYDPVSRPDGLSQNLYGAADDVNYNFDHNPASQIVGRITSNDAYVYAEHSVGAESYSVNGLNQYTSVDAANLSYDANGNLTSDGSTTYAYDIENRLRSATGLKNAALKYDPLGRLFETSGGNATTHFLYDGDALIAEYNTSGALVTRYVHGPEADTPLVEYTGAGVYSSARQFLYADHLGSITARTSSNGTVVNINQYDSFGIPDSMNSGRFAYTGQIAIPELDLYHYKARIYSPKLGRFLQTDPVGYDDNMNMYAYVGNDPMTANDPSGEIGFLITAALSAAVDVAVQLATTGRVDPKQVAISALAGAAGFGAAKQIASAVRALGATGRAATAANAAGNATAGAGINVTAGLANDLQQGKSLDESLDNVGKNATWGALGGAAGSVAGEAAETALRGSDIAGARGTLTALGQRGAAAAGDILEATVSSGGGSAGDSIREAPFVPNGGSVALPPKNVPKAEDFIRQDCPRPDRSTCP